MGAQGSLAYQACADRLTHLFSIAYVCTPKTLCIYVGQFRIVECAMLQDSRVVFS